MSDCASCRAYRRNLARGRHLACHEADYYLPYQMRYCRPQVMWYLLNRDVIRSDGKWPPDPRGTGYIDPAIRSKTPRIPSEVVKLIIADIESRLGKTGKDGRWLIDAVQRGATIYDLSRDCLNALNYVSGSAAKLTPYFDWLSQRERRNRVRGA